MKRDRDQRFRRHERLRLRNEFERAYSQKRMAGDQQLLVYVCENDREWTRLGLSVSRRVGGAVVRNLIRRRIKEAFRKNKEAYPAGIDVLCVVKPGPPRAEKVYAELLPQLVAKALSKNPRARTP